MVHFNTKYFTPEEKRKALNDNQRKWREAHPEKAKGFNAHLKRKLGKTEEDYFQLLREQNNSCKICGRTSNNRHTEKLYWDHDHLTGKARGLLCSRCNSGLGFFGDDVELITKALNYLKYF